MFPGDRDLFGPHDENVLQNVRAMMMTASGALRAKWSVLVATFALAGTAWAAAGAPTFPSDPIVFGQAPSGDRSASPSVIGSRIVRFDPTHPEQGATLLTEGFADAGKPDVSFDGTRILFVGKRATGDRVGVWEMAADGSSPREVIRFDSDCRDAIYLSDIFTLDAEQPVDQMAFAARAPEDGFLSIYTCRTDGRRVRRITFAPGGASDLSLLRDGRIVFRMGMTPSEQSLNEGVTETSALFTVNTDGTDLFPFAALDLDAAANVNDPCEMPSGQVVFVESAIQSPLRETLTAVSRSASRHSRRSLAGEVGASVRTPSPLPNDRLLVSYQPTDARSFGLYILDLQSGSPPELLFDDPLWEELDPVVVAVRQRPAGRSSVVDDRKQTGQLYCLNAGLSDVEPKPPTAAKPIHRVRVWRATSAAETKPNKPPIQSSDGSARDPEKQRDAVLGEFLVEQDGSFSLQVPAGTPLRLETLDESGQVLREMHSWVWVMPGERRGCIGCHEDRELTPPNRHVLALRKLPQRVGGGPVETEDSPEESKAAKPIYP